MKYDFVEIGTSWFGTIVENCNESAVGICVEPIKEYLDMLVNKPNVKKINCGINFDNSNSDVVIHYVPKQVLEDNNITDWWVSGCNSINDYHPEHKWRKIEHLVKKDIVLGIPIAKLFIDNNIEELTHLKIDTEGGDAYILMHFLKYLENKPKSIYPKKITFESNSLTPSYLVDFVIYEYLKIGYVITFRNLSDTELEFRP